MHWGGKAGAVREKQRGLALGAAALLALAAALYFLPRGAGRETRRYEAVWYDLFDTVTTLRGYAAGEAAFEQEAGRIHDALLEYHRLCDIYNDYPGLVNLKSVNDGAGGAPLRADPRLLDLLELCRSMYEDSGGAVDVTMGAVLALWHTARENETPPDPAALVEAAKHGGFAFLEMDAEAMTLRLTDAGARLDVGAVAKGWAAARVMEHAPEGYLLSVGGNVCASGPKPGGAAWVVALENPDGGWLHTLELTRGSVVTSGDYQRFFLGPDGTRYHHIIDPETLQPARRWRAVSVLHPDSGVADALSTALFVLDRPAGEALVERRGGAALWVALDGEEYRTEGFLTVS